METDTKTSNVVEPARLVVVASVSAVVCKGIQKLQGVLGPAVHRGMVSIVLWGVSLCNARAWPTTTMLEEV